MAELLGIARYVKEGESGEVEMLFSENLFKNLKEKLTLQPGANLLFVQDDYGNVIITDGGPSQNNQQQ